MTEVLEDALKDIKETNASWEEFWANMREASAKAQEARSTALNKLHEGEPLNEEDRKELINILEIRKSNILNLCGLIDEYREMPCESLFDKFHDATKRYGKLT